MAACSVCHSFFDFFSKIKLPWFVQRAVCAASDKEVQPVAPTAAVGRVQPNPTENNRQTEMMRQAQPAELKINFVLL
ncbi:hypothetical protein CLOSTMETH_01223 [[Clostridium] methylpentosum DSM 5476]|uniref:Uncharacterized protein n=1 Tax=[Clostridium] methylpentosum DSM 5476 TaxID=537013 RepID=C0EBK4_9FIRM|nr:hypothetical protein CLOSTMETH_01223 [[Clostridium] methylpentosum DSM 5476]